MQQGSHILKTLEPNTLGRDFVIGDLHGSMPCFKTMLEGINFDPTKDRIISVGDLIDRGPENINCLNLLNEPWFHAVQGNHEKEMVDVFSGLADPTTWFNFGGKWAIPHYFDWQNLKSKQFNLLNDKEGTAKLLDLVRTIKTLPVLITIKMPTGKKFHVMHAELPHGEKITDSQLSDIGELERIINTDTRSGSHMQWGRSIFGQFISHDLPNRIEKFTRKACLFAQQTKNALPFNDELSHIISGHSVLHQPVTFMGQTNIDTGAYETNQGASKTIGWGGSNISSRVPKWAGLTCVNLHDWKFFKSTPTVFSETGPIVLCQST